MYDPLMDQIKWIEKILQFSSYSRPFNFPSADVIGDVVDNDLDRMVEGRGFESAIFLTFMHDYLANDDIYDTNCYGYYIGNNIIYELSNLTMYHFNGQGQCYAYLDSEYLDNIVR